MQDPQSSYDVFNMMDFEPTSMATVVRSLRARADVTQAELARRLGTTQSAVSRWENAHEEPRWSTLRQIAAACELNVTIVVDEDVDRAQLRSHLAMSPADRLRAVANVSRLRSLSTAAPDTAPGRTRPRTGRSDR